MPTPSKQSPQNLRLADFEFDLPPALIAQSPTQRRSESRLLRLSGDAISHLAFADLPDLLAPDDLLVVNNTRVMKARLHGRKQTGGAVELLVERVLSDFEVLALLRASKKPALDSILEFPDGIFARVLARDGEFFRLRFERGGRAADILEQYGRLPLPPYITHADDERDAERYQTVYATQIGAVAAPTAGLHFDQDLLARLRACGVAIAPLTLHVGTGTFQPVRSENIAQHRMHAERYEIPAETAAAVAAARAAGGRVIAVGTTSLRALESACDESGTIRAGPGETRLFIVPGFRFRVVDRLLTNFHLPRSTLLMLVSAFAGVEAIRRAYAAAIAQRYRFFSYGDAMLIDRLQAETATAATARDRALPAGGLPDADRV